MPRVQRLDWTRLHWPCFDVEQRPSAHAYAHARGVHEVQTLAAGQGGAHALPGVSLCGVVPPIPACE